MVALSLEFELGIADAIGHSASNGAEVGAAIGIRIDGVQAGHHVGQLSGSIGDMELGHDGAVVGDLHREAVIVGERVKADALATDIAEGNLGNRSGSRQMNLRGPHTTGFDDRPRKSPFLAKMFSLRGKKPERQMRRHDEARESACLKRGSSRNEQERLVAALPVLRRLIEFFESGA